MFDIPSITAAITGLKTAAEIAKAMKGLQNLADVQTKVIELQSAILDAQTSALTAQSDQLAMMQKMRELEEEIARIRAWNEEKNRYKLTSVFSGAFAYGLKESVKGSEAPHWICSKCYDDGRRTILQPKYDKVGFGILVCPTCNAELHSRSRGIAEAKYVGD